MDISAAGGPEEQSKGFPSHLRASNETSEKGYILYSSATCRGYLFHLGRFIYLRNQRFMDTEEYFEVDSLTSKRRRRRYNVGAANEVRLQLSQPHIKNLTAKPIIDLSSPPLISHQPSEATNQYSDVGNLVKIGEVDFWNDLTWKAL
jgi:hypothetical protein